MRPSYTVFSFVNMAMLRDFVKGAKHVDDSAPVEFVTLGEQTWHTATAIRSENLDALEHEK
jgi:hypothetical protein